MKLQKLNEFIDSSARVLVGTLLKRVEVLEKEKVLTSKLYKSLTKELIYENARNLKKLIEVYETVGKVEFKLNDTPEKER